MSSWCLRKSCSHSEKHLVSDRKPRRRIKDPAVLRRLHLKLYGEPCESCEHRPGTELHHVKLRSQSGDDSEGNLVWICALCHRALHGNPYVDIDDTRWDAKRVRRALRG